MRTRRHKLQVSTFPFLAVLLCAMGSLILFLLVIDRRAQAVARARLHDVRAKQEASQATRQAEVEADYQRQLQQLEQQREEQRRRIHAALLTEHEDLQAQAKSLASRLGDADRKTRDMQAGADAARELLTQYEKDLAAWQSALAQRQRRVDQTKKLAEPSKADLERLTLEVVQLEVALREIQERKRREKDTYSLVPYKGRRGEQRQPIYVECVPDGIVFHPDRTPLTGLQLTAEGLRDEIQRRVGGVLRTQALSGKTGGERAPYLLFLVRPNSIETYYRVLSFIPDDSVAFGYELIDAHWVLDFSNEVPIPQLASDSAAPQVKDAPRGSTSPRGGTSPRSAPGPWSSGADSDAKPVLALPGTPGGSGNSSGGTGSIGAWPPTGNPGAPPALGGSGPASGSPGMGASANASPSPGPATAGTPHPPGLIGMGLTASVTKPAAGGTTSGLAQGPAAPTSSDNLRLPGTDSRGSGSGAWPPTGNPGAPPALGGSGPASGTPGMGASVNASPSPGPATAGTPHPPGLIGMGLTASGTKPAAGGTTSGLAQGPAAPTSGDNLRLPGTDSRGSGSDPFLPGGASGASGPLIPGSGPFTTGSTQGGDGGRELSPISPGKPPGSGSGQVPGLAQRNGDSTPASAGTSQLPNGSGMRGQAGQAGQVGNAGQTGQVGRGDGSTAGGSRQGTQGGPAGPQVSLGTPAVDHQRPGNSVPSSQQPNGMTAEAGKAAPEGQRPAGQAGSEAPAQAATDRPMRGSPGEEDGPESLDVLAKLAPPGPAGPRVSKTPRPPLVLSHVLGNRDFLITVVCKFDHVLVQPGGTMYPVGTKNQAAVDEAFRKNLKQMIDRRQATVRPGESPYRPMIHFQVAPDGLRSYFAMYPLLEPLQVPMTRENLDSPGK